MISNKPRSRFVVWFWVLEISTTEAQRTQRSRAATRIREDRSQETECRIRRSDSGFPIKPVSRERRVSLSSYALGRHRQRRRRARTIAWGLGPKTSVSIMNSSSEGAQEPRSGSLQDPFPTQRFADCLCEYAAKAILMNTPWSLCLRGESG
jgi:hypothetical protein